MHACALFFFLMPSTNVEGKKNCSTVIDDSTKQKVRSLHSSVFFPPPSDVYIMMIMKVAEKSEAAFLKLFKHTRLLTKKGLPSLSARVRLRSDLGLQARVCRLSKTQL